MNIFTSQKVMTKKPPPPAVHTTLWAPKEAKRGRGWDSVRSLHHHKRGHGPQGTQPGWGGGEEGLQQPSQLRTIAQGAIGVS